MTVYRGMDRTTLDAAYNNGAAVTDSPAILADWDARSRALRAARPQLLDLRYGPDERNRIDYFAVNRDGPLFVFIHGGYWQMRAKENFSFIAEGPLAHGINVALMAYTLAPAKRLEGIVNEVRSALEWVAARVAEYGGDPNRIYVSGWSAGAHLAALSINEPAVRGGLAISGLYDLEPIQLCYVNDKLGLDREEALRLSPLRNLPRESNPIIVAYGTDELPELRRQSEEFAAARSRIGLPGRLAPLAGCNHFTILEELARPEGALTSLVLDLLAA